MSVVNDNLAANINNPLMVNEQRVSNISFTATIVN